MALERTFSILKPDATTRNLTGAVNAMIEGAGLRIIAQKRIHMTRAQAETFYGVHAAENAIGTYRQVMGATNPANAEEGTIRKAHAVSVGENTVHGSDAAETAAIEIAQFFAGNEIVG
jgi:nucleoside-diphosphate kinase